MIVPVFVHGRTVEPIAVELYAQAVGRDPDVDFTSVQYLSVGPIDREPRELKLDGFGQSGLLVRDPIGIGIGCLPRLGLFVQPISFHRSEPYVKPFFEERVFEPMVTDHRSVDPESVPFRHFVYRVVLDI